MAEGGSSTSSGNEGVTNFLKLQNLFGASTSQIYRSHFVTLWNHYFGTSSGMWQNTKDFVNKKFISEGIGKEIYDSCDEYERRILRAGNISLWDLTLLLDVIKKLQNAVKDVASAVGGVKSIKFLSEEKLDETKTLWEEVDYQSRIIVDYGNYGNWMAKVVKALEENGMSKEEIFTTAFFLEKPAEEIPELDAVASLAEKLKQNGNLAVGKGEFEKGLKFYTEAIKLDGLPEELLGTLYCDRSLCNIQLNKFDDAKFDAKCAMTLRPSWFKGYLRLGKVFEEMDEFNPSLQFYKLAEVLEPGSKKVATATKACKIKRDNPQFKSTQTGLRNILNAEKHRLYRDPGQIELEKELVRLENPAALCREAHRYESGGLGYPQDYKRAAEFYSKAASKGYPLGIMNLADFTMEGKGVAKDVSKAFEMYKQVATMAPFKDVPIPGDTHFAAVSTAQMKMGSFYRDGEAVPRDLKLAVSWYKKSVGNGCHASATSLGFIYKSQYNPLAILYFMMGAYMGNVMAMEQLAMMHMYMEDLCLAQLWCKLAIHCGSFMAKKHEHIFMQEELTPDFNPFHFRGEIKKHLESSEEFKEVMKEFDHPKFSPVWKVWNSAFQKVPGIPEEAEKELCKAMKNI